MCHFLQPPTRVRESLGGTPFYGLRKFGIFDRIGTYLVPFTSKNTGLTIDTQRDSTLYAGVLVVGRSGLEPKTR
jgi:hypothetical protein